MTRVCHLCIALLGIAAYAAFAAAQQEPPASPITSAREYFGAYGIDFGTLRLLVDSRELQAEELDPVLQILARIPRISADEYQAWQKTDLQPERFEKDASDLRAEAMRLQGRAKRVVKNKLETAQEERYQFEDYFQVELELDGYGPAIVYAREVPAQWRQSLLDKAIDERVSLWGIFLKFGAAAEGKRPPLYFAANRLAWHPDREDAALQITPAIQLLGDLGVDVSLLSTAIDQQPLRAEEREAFYEVLRAAVKADPQKLAKAAANHASLAPLLTQPKEQRGQLVSIEGTIHRATKILIDEPDIRKQLGIDHYYELVIFVPERIRYKQGKDGPEVLYDTFPVVACVATLPKELPVDEDISETVRVTGFYFKLYAYSSQFMQKQLAERKLPGELRQHSPLVIAPLVAWVPRKKPEENTMAGPLAFIVVAIVIIAAIWGFASLRGSPTDLLQTPPKIAPPEGAEEPPAKEGMPQIKSHPPNL